MKNNTSNSKPRVILFHPMTLHEKNYRYFYIPYSVLSVASLLPRTDFDVTVIDNNIHRLDKFEEILGSDENLLAVGISSMMGHQIRDGLAFASAVRDISKSIPIIWGGALPTILPMETLAHELVDIIVQGQGEDTFLELIKTISSGGQLNSVNGIAYKVNGKTTFNPPRAFKSVHNFPPYRTVFDLINVSDYIRFDEHINTKTINYHSSQGCPFNCGFCCETSLWERRWSAFSAEETLEDLAHLVSKFGVNGIKFYDSEFFIDQKRVIDFASGVIERNLRIKWAASVHPRNLDRLTDAQFRLLKESGVSRLLLGAESGVQEELELVGKGTNEAMIKRLAERCKALDIVACFTFVTGYPTSPSGSIEKTLSFAKELRQIDPRHECKVHFYAPYPGTPLYPYALNNGFIPPKTIEEWSWYDYYDIVTPWVEDRYQKLAREFNEEAYPYLHPLAGYAQSG